MGCVLTALGCSASRMSSWAVQDAASAMARGLSERTASRTPVMGADETIVNVRGKAKLVGFVADAESGELVKAVVTDDLSTCKLVVDGLGLEYQVCVVHVIKNAARRLRKVKGERPG